jgi:hypothetical protein
LTAPAVAADPLVGTVASVTEVVVVLRVRGAIHDFSRIRGELNFGAVCDLPCRHPATSAGR